MDVSPITYWGQTLSPYTKQHGALRVGFWNIRSLGTFAAHHKNSFLYSFISRYDFDVFGIAEVNVNWSAVPVADRAFERSCAWWPTRHVSFSYAKSDPVMNGVKFQPGGTAI